MTTRDTIRGAVLSVPGVLARTVVDGGDLRPIGPAHFVVLVVVVPTTAPWSLVNAISSRVNEVRPVGVSFEVRHREGSEATCFACGADGCDEKLVAGVLEVRLCGACHAAQRLDPSFVLQAQDVP